MRESTMEKNGWFTRRVLLVAGVVLVADCWHAAPAPGVMHAPSLGNPWPFTGDCPNFRGGRGFLHGKTTFRRENGTVPFGRKGTGTFFGLPVSGVRATDKRPKNEPVPGGPVNGYGNPMAAKEAEAGQTATIMLPGNVPLEVVSIPAGTFLMGQSANEQDAYPNKEALMNPCPVVDHRNNSILLLCNKAHQVRQDHHQHFQLVSQDNGHTWSEPIAIGDRIAHYDDRFNPGPGVGIQLRNGRLVIPGYTGEVDEEIDEHWYSRVLYSDDSGTSWILGLPVPELSDECQAVELEDGTLMLNMRGNMGMSCRGVAISSTGGQVWSNYSSIVRLPDGDVGLLFEGGEKHRREWIRFVRFSLSWLTHGADQR
ncbi:MAG: hypothetical protein A2W31_08390 [Planctomycetes bacterium RBG_16_64_10]|nr:MAG: hypothetical protein A2W31_08390 [Planctomycetes bacterium RBG_16_64_10]